MSGRSLSVSYGDHMSDRLLKTHMETICRVDRSQTHMETICWVDH